MSWYHIDYYVRVDEHIMAVSDTSSVRTEKDIAVLSPDLEEILGSLYHCKSELGIRNKPCRCVQRQHFKRGDRPLR